MWPTSGLPRSVRRGSREPTRSAASGGYVAAVLGAVLRDAVVDFEVWAPSASRVAVRMAGSETPLIVDDGWWREPVARACYKVVTRSGLLCIVFLDEIHGTWHLERVFD